MDLEVYQCSFAFPIRDYGTPHPQCMPEEYKCAFDDPVHAYRRYYVNDKKDIAKWEKSRLMPKWFTQESYTL
jgi:hypothetical protein